MTVLPSERAAVEALTLSIHGRTVIDWTLSALESTPEICEIVVAFSQATPETIADAIVQRPEPKPRSYVTARSWLQAVGLALESAGPAGRVLIHEANRPLVSDRRLTALLAAARSHPAAAAALPVKNTYKRVAAGRIEGTVPRDMLFFLQGPWIFDRSVLTNAVQRAQHYQWSCADELALCSKADVGVSLLEGEDSDIPVVTDSDVEFAERLWQRDR